MDKQRGTFRYPGGKTLIRRWIIDYFPQHECYVEPFGGGGSILVGKDRSDNEVYNDINGDCVAFFEACKYRGEELAEWIRNTPYSRELFDRYCESYPDWPDDLVEHAGRFAFVQSSMFGGKVIGQSSPTFSVKKTGSRLDATNPKIWARKDTDITWIQSRFRGVHIEQLDYADLFEKYDVEGGFFYCDPPYIDVGDGFYQNGDSPDDKFDHVRFAEALSELDAPWLCSYGEEYPPTLEDYHHVTRRKETQLSSERPQATERLIMNYDPSTTAMFRGESQQGLDDF